jgi:protein ImuB
MGREAPVLVTSWAGPWPVDERWWDPAGSSRVVRLQLVDVNGRAYLVAGEMPRDENESTRISPRWSLEGIYD